MRSSNSNEIPPLVLPKSVVVRDLQQSYQEILNAYKKLNPEKQPGQSRLSYFFSHVNYSSGFHGVGGRVKLAKFEALNKESYPSNASFLKAIFCQAYNFGFSSSLSSRSLAFVAQQLGMKRVTYHSNVDMYRQSVEGDEAFYQRVGKKLGLRFVQPERKTLSQLYCLPYSALHTSPVAKKEAEEVRATQNRRR